MLEKLSEGQEQIRKNQPDLKTLAALAGLPGQLERNAVSNEACGERIEAAAKSVTDAVAKPTRSIHRHLHTFDIKSNWVLFTMSGLILWTIFSLFIIDKLNNALACHSDNDLKYRHIMMKGGITAEGVAELQHLFGDNRDEREIKEMRKTVEQYEQAVTEQAEKIQQANLNATQAKQLQQKAETLKNKK